MLKNFDLKAVLQGCQRGNPRSQRKLYEHFYGYAMSICLRYAQHREEAVEILNDAFFKVFTHLDQYNKGYPFQPWLRRILINTAIDYHRHLHNLPVCLELREALEVVVDDMPMPPLSEDEDVLPILQQLPPAYRIVFNLSVMEGYHHHEIAEMLGISASTSRSNLVRAKEKLRSLFINKSCKPVKTN